MMDALSSVAVVDHFVISTEDKVKNICNRLPEKTHPHDNPHDDNGINSTRDSNCILHA